MSQISKYLRRTSTGYAHYCPCCDYLHHFSIDVPLENGAQWRFMGNAESPTFEPSMNIGPGWCHYRLIAGVLHYQSDCKHHLASQTVKLPELPGDYVDDAVTAAIERLRSALAR